MASEVAQDDGGRVDQRAIRRANLSAVVRRVAADGPRSRSTIAVETGFNKSTVSSLVAELLDIGLLAETGEDEHPGRVGRPAQTVRLNGEAITAVGLEVNVDYLAACVSDLGGRVRHQRRVEADNAGTRPASVLRRLGTLARQAITAVEDEGARVVGVAVALPGLVDRAGSTLIVAPNLGWRDVAVAERLGGQIERSGLLMTMDNEANLAALAEHWEGAVRDLGDVVCVSGDVGIGAGVLVGGDLFRGSHGFGGELGHIVVDPSGEQCACGSRGCLETVAGQAAVLRRAAVPHDVSSPGSGARELLVRAQAGDAAALAALDGAGRALGTGLASVVNLLDPEAIVLGGYLAPFADWLAPPIADELARHVLASRWAACEIRAAALADGAAARGAAASLLREVLADPGLAAA